MDSKLVEIKQKVKKLGNEKYSPYSGGSTASVTCKKFNDFEPNGDGQSLTQHEKLQCLALWSNIEDTGKIINSLFEATESDES